MNYATEQVRTVKPPVLRPFKVVTVVCVLFCCAEIGNVEALATIAGVVDGTASCGAAIVQEVIPQIQTRVEDDHGKTASWNAVYAARARLTYS